MGHSIQEILKNINSKTTALDCMSILLTLLVVVGAAFFLSHKAKMALEPIIYTESGITTGTMQTDDSRPFASKNGKTYTFSWCQGGTQIKPSNKIYFKNEEGAQRSGRTLSKLCQK